MVESAWPFVAVLVGPKAENFRTVGTWQPSEKQVAIDWCCNWWQQMFGEEPEIVDSIGKYSDDHRAAIHTPGSGWMILVTQLGDAYRDDLNVTGT